MPIDFSVNNSFNIQQSSSQSSQNAGSALTGSLMGQAAKVVSSPLSLLASAAEELTFSVDTTDDFELEERKEKKKIDEALEERVEMYKELMHQVGKSEDIEFLKKQLRSGEAKDGALKEATRRFPDPSDAWAALSDALKELEADPSCPKEVINDIKLAMAELEITRGSEIKAGIFGATEGSKHPELADAETLRDFYRQTVCDYEDPAAVFKYIQKEYGSVSFDKAMEFLFNTISADINSDLPSMESTHLENVHNNLGQVRLLQSTHTLCENLLNRWENVHGQKNCPFESMELLGDMVGLGKERFLGAMHIDAIVKKAKPPDLELEVLFLQELLTTVRNTPPRLFGTEQEYGKVIDAVQGSVDNAITREDEWLASLEE